jgi:hypothetical protein
VRKNTLETSGEDVQTTLQTSGEDVQTTLQTSGEDVKTTLGTSGELRSKYNSLILELEESSRQSLWKMAGEAMAADLISK